MPNLNVIIFKENQRKKINFHLMGVDARGGCDFFASDISTIHPRGVETFFFIINARLDSVVCPGVGRSFRRGGGGEKK